MHRFRLWLVCAVADGLKAGVLQAGKEVNLGLTVLVTPVTVLQQVQGGANTGLWLTAHRHSLWGESGCGI
jgi:hypothetical protein